MSEKNSFYQRNTIKHLYQAAAISSADLSRKIAKSLPITIKILNELIEQGYVTETGYAPSTGGRRPAMYALRKDFLYIISVAMDQFVTRIVIMDLQNDFVTPIEKFELSLSNNPEALSILTEKIEAVIAQSGISKNKFAGIGLGMPGFIDVKKGINYSFLPVAGQSLGEYISQKTGLITYIDNDSSLIALAELRFGVAKNRQDAMIVNMGWGIGLGMILHGTLFRGYNGFAGEFSHIPLFLNGKLCTCGKRGCLETEASLKIVVEKALEGLNAGRLSHLKNLSQEHPEGSIEAIINAAKDGDQFAVGLLSEVGYNIGRGVAVLIHLLNPEVIILSGRGSSAGKLWQAPIQQALNEHCIPRLAGNTSIEISTLGYEAELIGAAALVMEHYERVPLKKSQETTQLDYS